MPIPIECPKCGKKLRAPDNAVGKRVRCPGCQEAVAVPAAPLVGAGASGAGQGGAPKPGPPAPSGRGTTSPTVPPTQPPPTTSPSTGAPIVLGPPITLGPPVSAGSPAVAASPPPQAMPQQPGYPMAGAPGAHAYAPASPYVSMGTSPYAGTGYGASSMPGSGMGMPGFPPGMDLGGSPFGGMPGMNPYGAPQFGAAPRRKKGSGNGVIIAPGIGLLTMGILGLLYHIVSLALSFFDPRFAQLQQGEPGLLIMVYLVMGCFAVVFAIVDVLIILGGANMIRLGGRGMAIAGAITCLLPCSLLWPINLGIGIWALVVLNGAAAAKAMD